MEQFFLMRKQTAKQDVKFQIKSELEMSNNLFPCDSCERIYKRKSSLLFHKKHECGKEAQFACPQCTYKAKLKHHLKYHYHSKHCAVGVFRNKFHCDKCGKNYKYKEGLYNHQKYECGVEPQFQCPYCQYKDEAEMFIDQNAVDPLGELDEVASEETQYSDDPINPENPEEIVQVKRTKKRKRKQLWNRPKSSAKKAAVNPSKEQLKKSDPELMNAQVVNVTTLRTIQRNATTSIIMPKDSYSENTTALRDLLRCTRIVKSASSSSSEMSTVNSYVGSASKEHDQSSESLKKGDSVDTVTTLRGIKRKIIHPVAIPEAISSERKTPLCELLRRTRIVKTVESSGPDRIINCSYESSDDNETLNFQENDK